ncbi:MAG: choice-of-anchor V domain-containing protein [Bryobacteraceae bacterium]
MNAIGVATVLLAGSMNVVFAVSDGAPAGMTNAPGESNCTSCHGGTPNSGPGRVRIEMDGGTTYTPGVKVKLRVIIEDPAARRWGFQLAARNGDGNTQKAGELASSDNQTQVLNESGSQWITHTSAGTRRGTANGVTFQFDWTPPQSGAVTLYAAANAANNNGNETGDRIYATSLDVNSGAGGGTRPAFTAAQVAEAWTRKAGMAPGAWVSITGTDLATQTANWAPRAGSPLPTTLGGVTVKVNDVAAPLSFVSPTKITLLVPAATPVGNVNVVVDRGSGTSDAVSVPVTAALPALQAIADPGQDGRYYAVAAPSGAGLNLTLVNARGGLLGKADVDSRASRGAFPGEEIELFATGLGKASDTPTDRIFSGNFAVATLPKVRFGETSADPTAAVLVAPGVYVVRVKVPDSLGAGDVPVVLDVDGSTSAANVLLTVQAQ